MKTNSCLKVLVVGFGSIGKRHIKNLLSISKIEVLVLTKHKSENLLLKKCLVFNKIEDCIKEKPNMAIIANNSSEHVETSLQLAKAGIHLFIEKPLSNNFNKITMLKKTVKNKKLTTMIGCNLRFHPCIIKIKKLIDQKRIGKIFSVQVECGSFLPKWHPNENYSKSYAARDDLGGGVILTCIHEIDYLYWFFGTPISIYSKSGKYSNLKLSSEDLSTSILEFPTKILTELHLDYFQQPDIRKCKIIGSKGTIEWNSESNKVRLFDIKTNKWKVLLHLKIFKRNQIYVDELKHFISSMNKNKKTINPLIEGIETLRIALSIKKSSKIGRTVKM